MKREEIVSGIRAVAAEHLDWHRELALEARLIEDLELDALRLLTLAVEVENRFRIALEPEDEAEIRTVADLVAAVERRLEGSGGSPSPPAERASAECSKEATSGD